MDNMLTSLMEGVKSVFKKKDEIKTIPKENLVEFIELVQSDLSMVQTVLGSLPTSDYQTIAKKIAAIKKADAGEGIKLYNQYVSKLRGAAASDEKKSFFESFRRVGGTLSDVLGKIDKQIDVLFEAKAITIYNTTVTQVMVFGALREIAIYADYCKKLFTAVNDDLTQVAVDMPKYKSTFIETRTQLVANVTNRVYTKTGIYNFELAVQNLAKTNNNLLLVDSDADTQFKNINMLQVGKINTNIQQLIKNAVPMFNIFGWIGESWALYQHKQYLKKKAEKEYLTAHVALLQMELSNTQDEAAKAKLEKIIATYDTMLAKVDKDLAEYESFK